jgi:hypothetical protein
LYFVTRKLSAVSLLRYVRRFNGKTYFMPTTEGVDPMDRNYDGRDGSFTATDERPGNGDANGRLKLRVNSRIIKFRGAKPHRPPFPVQSHTLIGPVVVRL